MFVPFRIPQTGYRPVVDTLFCFVLSVFYYPILKVKTLLLVSIGPFIRGKIRPVLHKTRIVPLFYTTMSHLIRHVLAKPRLILDEMCRLYGKFASYLRRVLFFLV